MILNLTVPGLVLLQEVGFDIVSMWGDMGYLAKGVLALLALAVIGLVAFAISSIFRRQRGTSR